MRIYFLAYVFLSFFIAILPTAHAQAEQLASAEVHDKRVGFARDFAQLVLSILHDPKPSFENRKDVLRRAFSKSVDIDWIAKFVLGRSWASANATQRERYTALYRKYLTESYVANFAENPDKRISDIKVNGVTDANPTDFTVATTMKLASQERMSVNYLVREKDDGYQVLDIAIENVSLIATHRSEFSALGASHGIDGVISRLEELLAKPKNEMLLSMK